MARLGILLLLNNEILDFIHRRWKIDSNFLNGNCYWFAYILITRFPSLEIYYLPIEGHFVAGDGNDFYDWTGAINIQQYNENIIKLNDIKTQDNLWYQRLVRDCIF